MKYRTFQQQFHQPIRDLVKTSTIRGKQWCNVGERVALKFWKGKPYRSKQGVIATAVVVEVAKVEINWGGIYFNGKYCDEHAIASMEGFGSWYEMCSWFEKNHGLPYTGVLTRWDRKSVELVGQAVGLRPFDITDHDWSEDFGHENGRYFHICVHCRAQFFGHKRRASCRKCSTPSTKAKP